jgi:hypothetical protein
MKHFTRRLYRTLGKPCTLLALASALMLLGLTGLGLARTQLDTGPESFLPSADPTALATQRVASAFGGDPVVVLLQTAQPGQLTAPDQLAKLLQLEGKLAQLPDVAAVYGPATVLNQVAGRAQDLLAQLVGYRDGRYAEAVRTAREHGADEPAATAAGRAATAEFDTRYGPLLIQGLPAGLPTLRNAAFVRTVAFDQAGDPRPQWRFVLPGPDAGAILVRPRQDLDQRAAEQLVQRIRATVATVALDTRQVTVSGTPVVAAAMAGTLRAEFPLLGGAALAAVALVFLLVRWTSWRHRLLPLVTTVLATAATLALFGLLRRPLTLPVIAVLPILLGVGSDFMTYLERRAPRRVVVTVGLSTSAAFGALLLTPVRAVQDLGLALAVGIAFAVAIALLLSRRLGPAAQPPLPAATPRAAASGRARSVVAVAAVVVLASGWALLPHLGLRSDLRGFAEGVPAIDDAAHVEQVMGSSGELTLAVSGPDTMTREALSWMSRAQDQLITAHGDQLRPVVSPPTLLGFLGHTPTDGQLDAALRLLPGYLTSSVFSADHRLAVLTFATRLDDAQRLLTLRDQIRASLPPPPTGLSVELTGLPMAAVAAYQSISDDRYLSNVLGLLAAGAVLLLGTRRLGDAGRAVGAAALATAAGFGLLWFTQTSLTPVTAALGSLTAAVGCEFTAVLAEAARRRDPGLRRAVGLAAAASAVGYATLGFSGLAVVSQFGVLLAGAVGLAYGAARLLVWLLPPTAATAAPASSPTPGARPVVVIGA